MGRPGEPPKFSARERQILPYIAQGLYNKEIAHHVGLTPGTTRIYISNMRQKVREVRGMCGGEIAFLIRMAEHLSHGGMSPPSDIKAAIEILLR